MLQQQHLQPLARLDLTEQEVDVLAHGLEILVPLADGNHVAPRTVSTCLRIIVFNAADHDGLLFLALVREVRAAELVQHEQSRHGALFFLEKALQTERQCNMDRQPVLI